MVGRGGIEPPHKDFQVSSSVAALVRIFETLSARRPVVLVTPSSGQLHGVARGG